MAKHSRVNNNASEFLLLAHPYYWTNSLPGSRLCWMGFVNILYWSFPFWAEKWIELIKPDLTCFEFEVTFFFCQNYVGKFQGNPVKFWAIKKVPQSATTTHYSCQKLGADDVSSGENTSVTTNRKFDPWSLWLSRFSQLKSPDPRWKAISDRRGIKLIQRGRKKSASLPGKLLKTSSPPFNHISQLRVGNSCGFRASIWFSHKTM